MKGDESNRLKIKEIFQTVKALTQASAEADMRDIEKEKWWISVI